MKEENLESFELLNNAGRSKLIERHHSAAFDNTIDWQWGKSPYNRIAAINFLAHLHPQARYLEIGCETNVMFHAVPLEHKVGVDPARGGTLRMTSDTFFEKNADTFDLIFIDGLHEYAQVHKDAVNALNVLSEGGWIAFHDMLPASWLEQHVPRLQARWTGDVWKVAFELAEAKGIEFRIISIDFGVGLMRRTGGPIEVPDLSGRLADKGFDYFHERHKELPVISWNEAVAWISQNSSVAKAQSSP